MIPKIIHYCWFGRGQMPALAQKCIASWKKFFPDYEIKEWNEDNFDVNIIPYTQEAYEAKKYAFVSDYARFWILYQYGGLYFDTDVEVIRPMQKIIEHGAFMGCEHDATETTLPCVAPGLGLGVEAHSALYKDILDLYAGLHFRNPNGTLNFKTVVQYTTEVLVRYGLACQSGLQSVGGISIYPKEYFCPIDYRTKECVITSKTVSIHHYAESWHGHKQRMYKLGILFVGQKNMQRIIKLCKVLHIIR